MSSKRGARGGGQKRFQGNPRYVLVHFAETKENNSLETDIQGGETKEISTNSDLAIPTIEKTIASRFIDIPARKQTCAKAGHNNRCG